MVAGYFGVASPAVRESGALGVRVFVRKDGGELRIGKYGWQALGEGVQNKDGVRTRYHNMLVRTVCASLRQAGTGCRECPKGFFRRIGLVKKTRAVASAEKALGEIRLSSDDTEKFKKTYRDLPAVALSRPQQMSGSNGSAAAIVTQPNSQENADVKEVLLKAQELLAKANSGTCSNSCNCIVA